MLQTLTYPLIVPDKAVDTTFESRILGRKYVDVRRSICPLWKQSTFGNIRTGIPIRVSNIPAFAFKNSVFSETNISTPRAELAGISWTDFFNEDVVLPRNAFKSASELGIRDSVYLPICKPSFSSLSEMPEVFNSNHSIMLFSYINDFVCFLPHFRSNVFSLFMPQSFESTPCSFGLKLCSAAHELPLFMPNILTQIELFYNSPIVDSCSKGAGININTNNSVRLSNFKFFFEINNYTHTHSFTFFDKSELRKCITLPNEILKSLPSAVLFNWYPNAFPSSIMRNNHYRIVTFRFNKIAASWNVIPYRNIFKPAIDSVQRFPNLMNNINSNLRMKFILQDWIGGVM